MKKVFLVFGIAAFSSASAQQKELFDIQKHLQKKASENKKVSDAKPDLSLPFLNRFTQPGQLGIFAPGYGQTYVLPNGDRVVSLPIDNMPCVKPDMSQFQRMLNPGTGNFSTSMAINQAPFPGQIPNISRPKVRIPAK